MGFYSPATIVNDAKRHNVKMLPIDVQHSDWFCTLENLKEEDCAKYRGPYAVRMGLKYAKGLKRKIAEAIAEARLIGGLFASEYDLRRRVPSIQKIELTLLATAGAFNWTGEKHHRRTALWHAERAGQGAGPLFENIPDEYENETAAPPGPFCPERRTTSPFGTEASAFSPRILNSRSGTCRMTYLY
jgi:error-prone DNA polymerase